MSYPAPQPPTQSQPAPATGYTVQPQSNKTNVLAIVALVSSFFISLAGIICGHIALNQIKKTGEGGRGLALAGTIIGYVGLAVGILWVIFVLFAIGASASLSTY